MESDNTLIQKLRGLLPEKTVPFIITDLCNQLETAIAGDGSVDQENKEKNSLEGVGLDDISSARIDDGFYTIGNAKFESVELALYRTDSVGSIFISTQMSHGVGQSYYEAYSNVISKVMEKGSRYKPIYRRVDVQFAREIGTKVFYCLMGAAIPKPSTDKAAED